MSDVNKPTAINLPAKSKNDAAGTKNPARKPCRPFRKPQRQPEKIPESLIKLPENELKTQLVQLERRYRSSLKILEQSASTVIFSLSICPSDPEFPFELPGNQLPLALTAPLEYPLKPLIKVEIKLAEIPKEIRDKAESDLLAYSLKERKQKTLLQVLNWFDKNLEGCLTPGKVVEEVSIKVNEKTGAQETVIKGTSGVTIKFGGSIFDQGELQEPSDHDPSSIQANVPQGNSSTELLPTGVENETMKEPEPVKKTKPGTSIRFHSIEFKNISIIESHILNLLIRCLRCKAHFQVKSIMKDKAVSPVCNNCRSVVSVKFTPELMVLNPSTLYRASLGSLEMVACDAADLLPSSFLLTCSECPSLSDEQDVLTQPNLIKNFALGQSLHAKCINCHVTLELVLGPVKFFKLGGTSSLPLKQDRVKKQKPKEDQLIIPGQPLPRNGTCVHYKKSFRWLRFPCCGRAFPCDICHDTAADMERHEMKYANKMICGWCSREQQYYQDKPCIHCGADLNSRKSSNSGHWEGGKGTRDKAKMSKHDKKKFLGLNKTESKKDERVGKKKTD